MQNPAEICRQYRADRCFLELPQYRAARGCKLVAVDATAMSRPILQKLGFAFVCNTVPLQYVQQKS